MIDTVLGLWLTQSSGDGQAPTGARAGAPGAGGTGAGGTGAGGTGAGGTGAGGFGAGTGSETGSDPPPELPGTEPGPGTAGTGSVPGSDGNGSPGTSGWVVAGGLPAP